MRKTMVRALSVLLILAFVPMTVLAEEWNLSEGSITVSAVAKPEGGTKQTVSQDRSSGKVSKEDAAPVIKSSGETANTVSIDAGEKATANVTIKDATVKSSGDAAIKTTGQGNVNLNIEGKNSVESSGDKSTHAGIEKNNNGNLTIGSASGDGELTVKGAYGGAGIGSRECVDVSNITITSGKIEAIGFGGAGIGSGSGANDSSNITITGSAKVKASGFGAGIGGGHGSNGSNITISGNAEVEASCIGSGAGIGGGLYGSGSNITITDNAKVKATGISGAGIGGGAYNGDGSNITISGNARVEAKSAWIAAGIGGGGSKYKDPSLGIGSNITISDSAIVKVSGGEKSGDSGTGAAIGDGARPGSNGAEVAPDITGLKPNGRIECYEPGADFEKDKPTRIIAVKAPDSGESTETRAEALYRVTDLTGKSIPSQAERKDGVLTVTVEAGGAVLTGTLRGLKTLQKQGVEKIAFTDGTYAATTVLADLIARGNPGDTYALTLGAEISLTLNGEEIALA